MTPENIYKFLLYISSKDRDTIINEIAQFIDKKENFANINIDDIEQFFASAQRGTKCDKEE